MFILCIASATQVFFNSAEVNSIQCSVQGVHLVTHKNSVLSALVVMTKKYKLGAK